ncbi:DUF4270 domain-containing protein [Flammeovirga kamogawensis]|uniref:DUF4270 domain-containing protein n=1 Tax=Flammeovirga kamogawensis TaxID=373891 RepID=A0ABX8GVN9_9BACT|nr:DUF4270 domain-containing protein [Flammeovirga kamogawensis]MBB6461097.1 hypothetical protein [Flammeovirga kamogawensis]QWG07663.1 DUF4270 domain-containing protein [Flammeovirga kamogawensis]TRX69473.1 DUF4270 domain-containing protein [Flammeovirga kamogawensis]
MNIKTVFTRAILFFAIIFCFACERTDLQTIVIGGDLIDDQTQMCYADTFEIDVETHYMDSLYTKNGAYFLAGYVDNGAEIGQTKTSAFTQLSIGSEEALNFDDRELDSLSLSLALDKTSIYGDTSQTITLEVYELSETIKGDSAEYFSTDSVKYYTEVLGSRTFKVSDIETDTVNIVLSNTFGQKIIDGAEYADQDDFASKIKGLAIRVKDGQTAAWAGKYSLENYGTVMNLHMHYFGDTNEDTIRTTYYFGFKERFNQIDYTPGTLTQNIKIGDVVNSENSSNYGFVFEGTGMVARIKFPSLVNLFRKTGQAITSESDTIREVHINQAQLAISAIGVDDPEFKIYPATNTPPPSGLYFGFMNSDGTIQTVSPDSKQYKLLQAQYPSSGDYQIPYSSSTQVYGWAKLAEYLQERTFREIEGLPLEDDGLVILPNQQSTSIRKLIFADDKNPLNHPLNGQAMKLKLIVYYAVFNDPTYICN